MKTYNIEESSVSVIVVIVVAVVVLVVGISVKGLVKCRG